MKLPDKRPGERVDPGEYVNILHRIKRLIIRLLTPPRTLSINKTGWYFILFSFAVGFAAVNTGNNLLYLILGAMLSFIVVSGILSNIALKKIVVNREVTSECFAKTPTVFTFSVRNEKKIFPSYLLRVIDVALPASETLFVEVKPQSVAEGMTTVIFPKRGRYEVSRLKVTTNFPFGLFQKGMNVNRPDEIIVFPRVQKIADEKIPDDGQNGAIPLFYAGHGSEPFSIKEFTPGDNPRHIHWKSTAKRDEFMKKEFNREREKHIIIRLVPSGAASEEEIEGRVEIAASLAAKYFLEGYPIGMILPHVVLPPASGYPQVRSILRELALFDGRLTGSTGSLPEMMGSIVDV